MRRAAQNGRDRGEVFGAQFLAMHKLVQCGGYHVQNVDSVSVTS